MGVEILIRHTEFMSDIKRTQPVDTIVIHSMFNPDSRTPYTIEACIAILNRYEVSAHYLIDREGKICRLVPEDRQAWHAGASKMPPPDNRSGVNAFSIGIELIGNEVGGFTNRQYMFLVRLTSDITGRIPIRYILGHSDIAPDRKTDPWNFDWGRYRLLLGKSARGIKFASE